MRFNDLDDPAKLNHLDKTELVVLKQRGCKLFAMIKELRQFRGVLDGKRSGDLSSQGNSLVVATLFDVLGCLLCCFSDVFGVLHALLS